MNINKAYTKLSDFGRLNHKGYLITLRCSWHPSVIKLIDGSTVLMERPDSLDGFSDVIECIKSRANSHRR